MRTVTTIFAAGLLCLAANAQEKAAPKKNAPPKADAGMSMPKPASEMKELRAFLGTWTDEEKFEVSPMMPNGGTGTGTNTCRLGPGGFSILFQQQSKGAMGTFTGHGVYSWDPDQKAYKAAWVDSMTAGLQLQTGHKEGENLVFTGESMMNGKKISTRDVWTNFTPTSHTLMSYMNDGSGEKLTMTIKFTKQEAVPAAPKK